MSLLDMNPQELIPDVLVRYGPRMLDGLVTTLELVAISVALGAVIGMAAALGRMSRHKALHAFIRGYTTFFRATPLLAQTFLIYYGAGQFRDAFEAVGLWWFFEDAFYCCLFAFTLNTAAYQAIIFRGAIHSVAKGQREAAAALGLTRRQAFISVILPQAAMVALRPFGNEIVLMIKGSAVAAIVTVPDLMGATRLAYARSFDFSVYLYAAVLYLAAVEIIQRLWNLLEGRLTRHLRRA